MLASKKIGGLGRSGRPALAPPKVRRSNPVTLTSAACHFPYVCPDQMSDTVFTSAQIAICLGKQLPIRPECKCSSPAQQGYFRPLLLPDPIGRPLSELRINS